MNDYIDDLRRRWEAEPTPQLTLHLAEEYRRLDRREEAVAVLETGVETYPRHLAARVALGRYRLELGQVEPARALLEQVVTEDPTHLVATKLLVRVYLELGRDTSARDRLDLYKILNEGDPEIEELEQRLAGRTPAAGPAVPVEVSVEAHQTTAGGDGDEPFRGLWNRVGTEPYWAALGAEGIFPVSPSLAAALQGAAGTRSPVAPEPSGDTVTLARLYLEQGHIDDAERTFRSVLDRRPDDPEAARGLEEITRLRGQEGPLVGGMASLDAEPPAGDLRARKVSVLQDYLRRIRAASGP